MLEGNLVGMRGAELFLWVSTQVSQAGLPLDQSSRSTTEATQIMQPPPGRFVQRSRVVWVLAVRGREPEMYVRGPPAPIS